MTHHSAHAIASIASRAGFTGKALTEAVSIALAASGGADHFDLVLHHEPLLGYRGLFGLSVDGLSTEDRDMLFDPHYSAERLYQLWRSNAHSWPADGFIRRGLASGLVTETEVVLRSREPSQPLVQHSRLAETLYHQRYLNG